MSAVSTLPPNPQLALDALRVLHVYSGNLTGGIETFLRTVARSARLVPAVQMDFALCFEGSLARDLRSAGATIHELGRVRLRDPRLVASARRALDGVIARGRYDVVVCHSAWPHVLFAPVVRRRGVRLVHFMHDIPNPTGWLDHLAGCTPPDLVLCNSDFTARSGRWLFRNVRRQVVRLPVLVDAYTNPPKARGHVRRALGTADDAFVVVQASRMQSWKGQHLLIEALAALRTARPWECWIVGGAQRPEEKDYERRLRQAADQRALGDRVKFLGQRDDVAALLGAADVYCQPNVRPEPFGLVFVEAIAAGLPVVATRMGGAIEIVSPSCGMLVEPVAENVAAAIRAVAESADRRAAAASSGPARARELCDPELRMRELERALRGQPVAASAIGAAAS